MAHSHPDNSETTDRAIRALCRWAWFYGVSSAEMRRAVVNVETERQGFSRALWTGYTRDVVPVEQVTTTRSRKLVDPIKPSTFDPWEVQRPELEEQTRQLCQCSLCDGAKKIDCEVCGSTALVRCDACRGTGKAISEKSGKIINCKRCRGKGEKKCQNCSKGLVKCHRCGAKGKVDRHLTLTEERFTRVVVRGDPDLMAVMPDVQLVESFHRPEEKYPLQLQSQWSGPVDDAPAEVSEVVAESSLRCGADPRRDRIRELHLQRFGDDVNTIRYALACVPGSVRVSGRAAVLHAVSGTRVPFVVRLLVLASAAVAAGTWGFTVWGAYVAHHAYYATTLNAAVLLALTFLMSAVALPPTMMACLPGKLRRLPVLAIATGPIGVLLVLQLAFYATGSPSMAKVRQLAAGDLGSAAKTATACMELDIDHDQAASWLDEQRMNELRAITDPGDTWEAATHGFHTSVGKQDAIDYGYAHVVAAVTAAQVADDYTQTLPLLGLLPTDRTQSDEEVQALLKTYELHRAHGCAQEMKTQCVVSALANANTHGATEEDVAAVKTEADKYCKQDADPAWEVIRSYKAELEARKTQCVRIESTLTHCEKAGTESWKPGRPAVEKKCEWVTNEIERIRKREEAARKRAEEKRAREAAYRRWLNSALVCRDGSYSPSCVCAGSHRGCCSRHGGVAGCQSRSKFK